MPLQQFSVMIGLSQFSNRRSGDHKEIKGAMEFINETDGVKAIVTKIQSGYSVAVQDMDSGMFLDSCIIYKTEEAAIVKAKEIL